MRCSQRNDFPWYLLAVSCALPEQIHEVVLEALNEAQHQVVNEAQCERQVAAMLQHTTNAYGEMTGSTKSDYLKGADS